MKKLFSLLIALVSVFGLNTIVKADTYINVSDLTSSTNNKDYSAVKSYDSLDTFTNDYKNNDLSDVYVTKFLFDGVTSVKSPDLDDFIDASSNDTKIKTLEITVINIKSTGNYYLSGTIKGAMIAVNTNGIKGNINIFLNGVNIDTDSKKAPAIFVYNKDKNYTDCKVTIKTVKNTKNYVEGGKLKKVSLIGSDELAKYSSYYKGDALTNYNNYTKYYGIYTSSEISNILFATVQADSEDLSYGDPYYFYKGSGAISSDIDIYFEGEGFLKVTSKNKEGIESKGNIEFSGGTGDYEIYSQDDCINTTTANSSGTTVRNDLTINVSSLLAIVDADADEGDAIDSNGKLYLNGGTVIAVAHPTSQDSGIDAQTGIYIKGGTVLATGNMLDSMSSDSKQKYIAVQFNGSITENTLIVIKDQDDKVITAFKTSRAIKTLVYSDSSLNYNSFKIYTGGEITGDESNGLYTNITSYTGGTEVSYNSMNNMINNNTNNNISNNNNNFILKLLIGECSLLAIVLLIVILSKIINKNKTQEI